ncbi:MAG: transcription elongation factor GreA [Bacteroidota bacterium]|nr:transcription elongation factor GreA [Candidatus Kapabacteria bacterium]MDW8219236.1 transcription elongation factor GreA [Bacteroidota bacterium]
MSTQPIYLSKERLAELEAELNELVTKGRAEIARKIAEARSHGDLRENSDYDAAKEEQGLLELRISKIQATLSRARTVEPGDYPADKVYILAKVKLKNKKTDTIVEYILVSEEEADFEKNKIAVNSPLGRALLGKAVGDIATVKVPAGVTEYEILAISR